MEEKVEKILDEMGIPLNIKGYRYLIKAVIILNNNKAISQFDIYNKIAQEENTTAYRVERAIRYTYENKQKYFREYLKLNCRINNSILIKVILREIEKDSRN